MEDSARLQREVDRLREAEELVREFSGRTVAFQEEERRRVARELHDGVNQWLCAIGFGLETVSKDVTTEQAACALAKARELLDRSIDEIRRISQTLRPGLLDDLGLVPAVRSLCDEFQDRTGITVNHDLDLGDQEQPAPVKTTAYRIIQEALYSSSGERAASCSCSCGRTPRCSSPRLAPAARPCPLAMACGARYWTAFGSGPDWWAVR